jgi:signal transduction histidine kinase
MEMWPLRGMAADAAVAGAIGVFVVVATVAWPDNGFTLEPFGWVLLVGACAVLVLRRRYPVAVLVTTLLACLLYYPFVGTGGPILLTFVVALFGVADAGRLSVAVGVAAVTFVAIIAGEVFGPRRHLGNIAMFMLAGWLVAVIAVGAVLHGRRVYLAEAHRRAEAAERLRIARELHDVLGHNISLINVQAGAALHSLDRDGTPVKREAIQAIKDTSRQALRELRSTLGVLRQVDEPAPLEPAPGLAALDELVDHARQAGIAVRHETAGQPTTVAPGVDLAAYRIVQEALTNVARHASAANAVVRVRYDDREVCVQVDDDGVGGADTVPGNGIRGMTERARQLGGTLTAGARTGGGFTVHARLPL